MNSVRSRLDGLLDRADRGRVGRVQHVQPRAVRPMPEGAAQHLGSQRGAAHAEQHHVLEALRRATSPRERLDRVRARASMRSAIVSQPRRLAISGVPAAPHSVGVAVAQPLGDPRSRCGLQPLALRLARSAAGYAGLDGRGLLAHATIVVAGALV